MSSGSGERIWRVAGVNFDHMHMGDLLRQVHEHPGAEIVGISDLQPERMLPAAANFDVPADRQFTDFRECLRVTQPDIVLLCPKTGEHADYVEWVAEFGVNVLVEKPMAATLADADRMLAAMQRSGKTMVINWPLAWYPPHVTAHRLVTEGTIGNVIEVHYYDGNQGPLRHVADKVEVDATEAARLKSSAWWYQKAAGGGSLQDYLGYGVTLGTWYHGGEAPIEVTCVVDEIPGLEVDEHSVTIARYAKGLSKYETRWGTFTNPWNLQPQPKCGFVIVGDRGTIASYDYEQTIRVQTADLPEGYDLPVDTLEAPKQNPVQYLIHLLETSSKPVGPLDPYLCRTAQRIVETAVRSAAEKRTLPLVP